MLHILPPLRSKQLAVCTQDVYFDGFVITNYVAYPTLQDVSMNANFCWCHGYEEKLTWLHDFHMTE